jgi:hypothetical protein
MSHRDQDYPDGGAALRALFAKRADEMTKKGENIITAGHPSERILGEWDAEGFGISRMPEDPLHARRISIGEADLPNSAYLVFRGDPGKVLSLLRRALVAADKALSPEGGGEKNADT